MTLPLDKMKLKIMFDNNYMIIIIIEIEAKERKDTWDISEQSRVKTSI